MSDGKQKITPIRRWEFFIISLWILWKEVMKGYKFKSKSGIDYIRCGTEIGEIAFDQQDGKDPPCFGCDAKIKKEGLCITLF